MDSSTLKTGGGGPLSIIHPSKHQMLSWVWGERRRISAFPPPHLGGTTRGDLDQSRI